MALKQAVSAPAGEAAWIIESQLPRADVRGDLRDRDAALDHGFGRAEMSCRPVQSPAMGRGHSDGWLSVVILAAVFATTACGGSSGSTATTTATVTVTAPSSTGRSPVPPRPPARRLSRRPPRLTGWRIGAVPGLSAMTSRPRVGTSSASRPAGSTALSSARSRADWYLRRHAMAATSISRASRCPPPDRPNRVAGRTRPRRGSTSRSRPWRMERPGSVSA